MPSATKQLGGVALGATTLTPVYTVPSGNQAVLSSVSICNRGSTQTTFRLSHAVAGAADANGQYLYYDAPIAANSTVILTSGLCLGPADVLRAYGGNANLTVVAWGQEGTPPLDSTVPLPLALNLGGTGADTAPVARTNLGLGTMSTQNANAVAITGGTANFTGLVGAGAGCNVAGTVNANNDLNVGGLLHAFGPAQVDSNTRLSGAVGINGAYTAGNYLTVFYSKTTDTAIQVRQTVDTGAGRAIQFMNAANTEVGSVLTSATATAFNTSSDVRLKHSIEKLVGALGVVQLLNPVSFLWKADNSPGVGFAAHELQQVIPDAVTGDVDALNDDGSIRPQGVDLSKIVPYLVGAIQALTERVIALEAR